MDRVARLSGLPSVDELLGRPPLRVLAERHGRVAVVRAARETIARRRRALLDGDDGPSSVDAEDVTRVLREQTRPGLRRVLNATGVVLHTNLGRAPLAEAALDAIRDVAAGYSNLEWELTTGGRGHRHAAIEPLLTALTGCEAALVVNNGAGATWLVLAALGVGREAIVSRGELVEIGGGFRIPDVMAASGCQLVEVGTTNKTRRADYERAIGDRTALLVKVHRSNFALVGFTEECAPADLAALAHERGLLAYHDLGAGCLAPLEGEGLPAEPTVAQSFTAGLDVVTFSGDKLLGGPQAGVIAGRRAVIERISDHPLLRALRPDKLTLAALEATLRLHQDGRADEVPALRLLATSEATLRERAEQLCGALVAEGIAATATPVDAPVGGGSLPLASLRSWAVALPGPADALAARLRAGELPVVTRVHDGRVLLDLRTIAAEELDGLRAAVVAAAGRGGS